MIVTEPQLVASLTDAQIVALTLFGEARSQGDAGLRAVADVIRNRVAQGRYGATSREVCLRKWQFSCWTPVGGPSNYLCVLSAAKALAFQTPQPPGLARCLEIAAEAERPDTVLGSTHYMTDSLYEDPLRCPKWARRLVPACAVGDHVFFNSVD